MKNFRYALLALILGSPFLLTLVRGSIHGEYCISSNPVTTCGDGDANGDPKNGCITEDDPTRPGMHRCKQTTQPTVLCADGVHTIDDHCIASDALGPCKGPTTKPCGVQRPGACTYDRELDLCYNKSTGTLTNTPCTVMVCDSLHQ